MELTLGTLHKADKQLYCYVVMRSAGMTRSGAIQQCGIDLSRFYGIRKHELEEIEKLAVKMKKDRLERETQKRQHVLQKQMDFARVVALGHDPK